MKRYVHLLSTLNVEVFNDPTGGFFAVVPGLPGCGSQGDSENDALENLDDAIMTVLDVLREDDPERLLRLCGSVTQDGPTRAASAWVSTMPPFSGVTASS